MTREASDRFLTEVCGWELAEAEADLRKLKESPDDPSSEMRGALIEAAIYRRTQALTAFKEASHD